MKILISWLAFNNDFTVNNKISKESPTIDLHQNYFNHDIHYLLFANEQEENLTKIETLYSVLKEKFPKHRIEKKCMNIEDVINVKEIKTKCESMLVEFRNDDVEIYISPGTPAMQTAWYILAMSGVQNVKLLQSRPAKYSKSNKSEFFEVEVEKSSIPYSAIIKENIDDNFKNDYLITSSIAPVFEKARKIAATDKVTTLIKGENGTGKEYLARFIHDNSIRSKNKFIAVNCASLSDSVLESRLFGYMKGAFTNAIKDSKGFFEEAEGGTLFLDEIGDISKNMQQSLLRVLEEKEIIPVGSSIPKKIDVRIISASNKHLLKLVKEQDFREDLYYRLAVIELELPPLRDRGIKDLEKYLEFFIENVSKEFNKPKLKLSDTVKKILLEYQYPGNIRELNNIIQNFYVFCNDRITKEDIPMSFGEEIPSNSLNMEAIEKKHIEYVLRLKNNNQNQTYRALGFGSVNTLKDKIKKYGIEISNKLN